MKTVTSQQTTKIPLHYVARSFTGLYLWLGNADEQYDVKHMIQRHVQKKSSLAALNTLLTKMEKERKNKMGGKNFKKSYSRVRRNITGKDSSLSTHLELVLGTIQTRSYLK